MSRSLALRSWFRPAAQVPGQFGRWWIGELRALLPDRVLDWMAVAPNRRLVVGREDSDVVLRLVGRETLAEKRIPLAGYSPAGINEFLTSLGIRRKDVPVGLRLPSDKFFFRAVALPTATRDKLDDILALDLTRRTPFRLDDVYHDNAVDKSHPGKLLVHQWLVRRDFVAEVAAELQLDETSFVEGASLDERHGPMIRLRAVEDSASTWARRVLLALLIVAALTGLAAGGLKYIRQQAILDELEARIAVTRAKAQQVRAMMNQLEQRQAVVLRLRARRSDHPGLLEIWQEATQVLPSHTWLTELRLTEGSDKQGQQVTMTGFSTAASSLVTLIDRSPVFTEASLTAPITLDPVEARERFALQARVRPQPAFKSAAK